MNEWLKVMLEEIRRKRAETDERRREHERREQDSYDEYAGSPRRVPTDRERR